jgi:hypothetical protein
MAGCFGMTDFLRSLGGIVYDMLKRYEEGRDKSVHVCSNARLVVVMLKKIVLVLKFELKWDVRKTVSTH